MTNVQAKRRRRWTRDQWHTFIVHLSTCGAFFLMGYVVGHLR